MLPAIIAGAAGLAGGVMANRGRRQESARNRKFQERMRNTQWQASVADMRAAGINPALAYSRGPNAAPGGSMAQQMDAVSPAVSSAQQQMRVQEDLKQIRATTTRMGHEARSAGAKADLDEWRAGRLLRVKLAGEQSQGVHRLLEAELAAAEQGARRTGYQADLLGPLAGMSKAFLPLILALSQQSAGGLQMAANRRGSLARMGKFEVGRLARKATDVVRRNWKPRKRRKR